MEATDQDTLNSNPFTDFFLSGTGIIVTIIAALVVADLFRYLQRCRQMPPGPTGYPIIGYIPWLGNLPHEKFHELSKKYGPIFSVQMGLEPSICLTDWNLIKEALYRDEFLGRPDKNSFPFKCLEKSFAEKNDAIWRDHKRFVLKMLSQLGFGKNSLEEKIQEEVADLVARIRVANGKPLQIYKLTSACVSSIICYFLIGMRLGSDDPKRLKLETGFDMVGLGMGQGGILQYLPTIADFFAKFRLLGFHRIKELVETVDNFFVDEVEQHKKTFDPAITRDYIDGYLLEMEELKAKNKFETSSFTERQLIGNLRVLYISGSETTTNSIYWFLLAMVTNPEIQTRVQKEIDSVLDKDTVPSYTHRLQMPYTQAVIAETARWRPVAAVSFPRGVLQDTKLQGTWIPKGSTLMFNFWSVSMDESIWKDPEQFQPSRFLNEAEDTYQPHEAHLVFSLGKRNCPGESMAQTEVFLFCVTLLQHFTVKAPDENPVSTKGSMGATLGPMFKIPLSFVARE